MGESKTIGLVGIFDDPHEIVRAAAQVREAGYEKWDCHTPYPVHGLDQAMDLNPSPVPLVTLGAGFGGLAGIMGMVYYVSVVFYPIRVGEKALWSWPAFTPVFFEVFVLSAGVATFLALIYLCRLGRWHSPLHDSGVSADVTGGRFAVVLYGDDEQYEPEAARRLLESAGCADIRPLVEEEDEGGVL